MTGSDRDDKSGRYTTSYSDQDFIDAIQTLGGLAGTSEIAEEVGCTRKTAYSRLKSIQNKDQIMGRKVGQSLIWTIQKS